MASLHYLIQAEKVQLYHLVYTFNENIENAQKEQLKSLFNWSLKRMVFYIDGHFDVVNSYLNISK